MPCVFAIDVTKERRRCKLESECRDVVSGAEKCRSGEESQSWWWYWSVAGIQM